MSLIRQKDSPSLLINGDFNSGLSGWAVTRGFASHGLNYIAQASGDVLSRRNSGAPMFVAKMSRVDAAPGVPSADYYTEISQEIDRMDLWSYPSPHYITQARFTPISPDVVKITRIPGGTKVDDFVAQSSAQIAFAFVQGGTAVVAEEGDELLTEIPSYSALNGVFRAGATVSYSVGSGQPDEYYILASPGAPLPVIASHKVSGRAGISKAGSLFTVTIQGANTFNRGRTDGDVLVGIRPLDILLVEQVQSGTTSGGRIRTEYAAAQIVSISESASNTELILTPIIGAPLVKEFATTAQQGQLLKWQVVPTFTGHLVKNVPAFRFQFTVALSAYPNTLLSNDSTSLLLEPYLDIYDPVTQQATAITLQAIPAYLQSVTNAAIYGLGESAPTSDDANVSTTFRRHVFRFLSEFKTPPKGVLRLRIRYQPPPVVGVAFPDVFEVGDVALYRGDFTSRHDFSFSDDSSDTSTALPADKRSAIDRLMHKVDETAGVIPKGTVLLFTGSSCPPGFKRLDSIPNSPNDGIWTSSATDSNGQKYSVPLLPPPEGITYDGARNRTVMSWSNLPITLLDSNDKPIVMKGVGKQVSLATPGASPTFGELESVTIDTTQTKVQPGMSLRIRCSRNRGIYDLYNRKFDYSTMVRQISVTRQHFAGTYASSNPNYDGVTYPRFITFDELPQADKAIAPVGPKEAEQTATALTFPTVGTGSLSTPVYRIHLGGSTYAYTFVPPTTNVLGGFSLPRAGLFGNPCPVPGGIDNGISLLQVPNLDFPAAPIIGAPLCLELIYRLTQADVTSRGLSLAATKLLYTSIAQIPTTGNGNTTFIYFKQKVLVKVESYIPNTSTTPVPNGSLIVSRLGGGSINSHVGVVSGSATNYPFKPGTFTSSFFTGGSSGVDLTNMTTQWQSGQSPIADTNVNCWAVFTNPRLFDPAGVVVSKSIIRGKPMWSVRAYRTTLSLAVFGDVVNDVRNNNFEGLLVEPTGFIRYGDTVVDDLYPDGRLSGFSYGSMGHSHEITQGDAVFNENLAPRVANYKESEVSSTQVAKKHGHGYFPKYLYPIPEFVAFLMCEKI